MTRALKFEKCKTLCSRNFRRYRVGRIGNTSDTRSIAVFEICYTISSFSYVIDSPLLFDRKTKSNGELRLSAVFPTAVAALALWLTFNGHGQTPSVRVRIDFARICEWKNEKVKQLLKYWTRAMVARTTRTCLTRPGRGKVAYVKQRRSRVNLSSWIFRGILTPGRSFRASRPYSNLLQ